MDTARMSPVRSMPSMAARPAAMSAACSVSTLVRNSTATTDKVLAATIDRIHDAFARLS